MGCSMKKHLGRGFLRMRKKAGGVAGNPPTIFRFRHLTTDPV